VQESVLREKRLLSALVRGVALNVVPIAKLKSRARWKPFDFISMTPSLKLVWLLGSGEHEAKKKASQLEVVHQLRMRVQNWFSKRGCRACGENWALHGWKDNRKSLLGVSRGIAGRLG